MCYLSEMHAFQKKKMFIITVAQFNKKKTKKMRQRRLCFARSSSAETSRTDLPHLKLVVSLDIVYSSLRRQICHTQLPGESDCANSVYFLTIRI